MSGLSDTSAFETFDRMSQKIDQLEAEAEAGSELAGEISGDGREVESLRRAERVGAAAVSMSAEVERGHVVAAPDEMGGQIEVLLRKPNAPETRGEKKDFPRGAPPQRVGDQNSVARPHAALHRDARKRLASFRYRSRHSTIAPAAGGSDSAGTRIRALARACAAMSWLPAVARGSTCSVAPA